MREVRRILRRQVIDFCNKDQNSICSVSSTKASCAFLSGWHLVAGSLPSVSECHRTLEQRWVLIQIKLFITTPSTQNTQNTQTESMKSAVAWSLLDCTPSA